jgi:glycosyltransferase involved in cell wall biosynthesis
MTAAEREVHLAMLGSMPPAAAISPYCLGLARAVAQEASVEFLAFRRMYPKLLHPARAAEDPALPDPGGPRLRVHRRLTWYNPIGWIRAGLTTQGDLLHAQWWSWPLAPAYLVILGLFRLRRRPIVLTVHNLTAHENGLLPRIADRLVIPLADHFIVHSERNAQQLRERFHLSVRQVSTIPMGADHWGMRNAERGMRNGGEAPLAALEARRRLGIAPDRRTVLCFGTIRPYKGLDVMLRATAHLARRLPKVLLCVVGPPWERWGKYRRLIRRLHLDGHVRLRLGFVPWAEAATYWQAAELAVLPYRRFAAQSAVGALALGLEKPLIVADVGGLPHLVEDPRQVVPPNDPAALAEAVHAALADPSRLAAMAASARRLSRRFDWADVAQRTLHLYRTLLPLSSPRTSPPPRRQAGSEARGD